MSSDETHRQRARSAIIAARRGYLPKPSSSNQPSTSSSNKNVFETAQENSIEVYDDKFGRNSILTRSARMRKFKFYQYKPIQDTTTNTTPKTPSPTNTTFESLSPQSPSSAILAPRDDVLKGKVALIAEQSKELSELENDIIELEKKISDLNSGSRNGNNNINQLDEIFNLVNQKNDLLRRQMQLNILEQEKVLEKTNEELTKELRSLLSIDDSRKSQDELDRQQYLYDQLVALVNKRNELVLHMDVQEKGIDEDNALKATLKSVISDRSRRKRGNGNQDQNCCIQ